MKKQKTVGIMTMHRVVNYGSYLQAYALKSTIESIGDNKVVFVDYKFEREVIKPRTKVEVIKKVISGRSILSALIRKIHRKKFAKKYHEYLVGLGVNYEKNYTKEIDTLVVGSDEVFNCMQHFPVGYSRNLFGMGYEDKNVISYAASFGHTKYPQLKKAGIATEIGDMLSRFKAISVRDDNSEEVIMRLNPKINIYRHLDPVLIGTFANISKPNISNYIILYAYSGRLSRSEEKEIKKFAKKHNKTIISIGDYQRCADRNLIIDPLSVMSYFKYADYVITDTFHGTVFSIKMNTKFCTIIRKSNSNKLISLLKTLKCESRIVDNLDDIDRLYNIEINFEECNRIIREETERTKTYLKENI